MPLPAGLISALRAAALATVGVVAVATVVGFLGAWWWLFDIAANFRVQLLVLAVVVGASGAAFDRRVVAVAAVAALLNGIVVLPLAFESGREAAPGPRLHVLSFNVQTSNPNKQAVMDYFAESGADVIFILESSIDWERAALRAGLPYEIFTTRPADRVFGITVLTAQGVTVAPRRMGPESAVEVRLPFGGDELAILAIHPPSPISPSRAAARDAALADAAEWAAVQTGPTAVIGDLNATPWSHAFRSLVDDGDLTNSMRGYGLQPTWPANNWLLLVPIDHALISADLVAAERYTGPRLGSDHRPLHVVLAPAAD